MILKKKGRKVETMFSEVKEWVQSIKEKLRGHHRWKTFAYAGIVVAILFYVWLFHTNTGWLARQSFMKSFDRHPDRIVSIYAGNELISEYEGAYTIEQYQGYLVLIDFENETRTNIYGDVVAIIDSPRVEREIAASQ